MVDSPEDADYIIVFENYENTLTKQQPLRILFNKKTYTYSEGAASPYPILAGIYVNLHKRNLDYDRFRSHAYVSYLAETGGISSVATTREAQKSHLFCFTGRDSHPVRQKLLDLYSDDNDCVVRDTTRLYNLWGDTRSAFLELEFIETIRRSHFSICPRGVGANSIRLFESMRLGTAPIIISDAWSPPAGPDWGAFSIHVPERDLPHLKELLKERMADSIEMGQRSQAAFRQYFSPETIAGDILNQMGELQQPHRLSKLLRRKRKSMIDSYWATVNGLLKTKHKLLVHRRADAG